MICPFCHTELPEGLKFCSECGKPLETTAVPVSVAEAAEPCGQEPVSALAEASVPEASETSQPAPAQTAPEQAAPAATTAVYHSVLDPKPDKASRWATIGTAGWFGILLLMSIPLVNLICVLVWSFGGAKKNVKQSYARAVLLLWLIGLILSVAGAIVMRLYGASITAWLFDTLALFGI